MTFLLFQFQYKIFLLYFIHKITDITLNRH